MCTRDVDPHLCSFLFCDSATFCSMFGSLFPGEDACSGKLKLVVRQFSCARMAQRSATNTVPRHKHEVLLVYFSTRYVLKEGCCTDQQGHQATAADANRLTTPPTGIEKDHSGANLPRCSFRRRRAVRLGSSSPPTASHHNQVQNHESVEVVFLHKIQAPAEGTGYWGAVSTSDQNLCATALHPTRQLTVYLACGQTCRTPKPIRSSNTQKTPTE